MQKNMTPWLILDVTTECNLRCKHCHLWMSQEPSGSLTTEEKIRVLEEFAAWRGAGRVVLAGGETFLKPEEVFRLARRSQELGLRATALTNATLLREEWVRPILQSGLAQISISLDAPDAAGYDPSRGVAGTFQKAVHWIRRLVKERHALGGGTEVHVNTILKRGLLPRLEEHLDFVADLGVQSHFLSPLERTFANRGLADPYYEAECLLPDEASRRAFCLLRARGGILANTQEDLGLMEGALFGEGRERSYTCQSGEKNVIVDMLGGMRLCHRMEEVITEGRALGNVREASLPTLAARALAFEARAKMLACSESCKILACNRETVA